MKLNKLKKDFFDISISETKVNSHYSKWDIMSYLVAIALNNDSVESATGISPDTLLRRLYLGQGYDLPWLAHYNSKCLSFYHLSSTAIKGSDGALL